MEFSLQRASVSGLLLIGLRIDITAVLSGHYHAENNIIVINRGKLIHICIPYLCVYMTVI